MVAWNSGAAIGAVLTASETAWATSGVVGAVAGSADAEVVAAEVGGGIWILSKPLGGGRVSPVTPRYESCLRVDGVFS